jgi:hypothetical protein
MRTLCRSRAARERWALAAAPILLAFAACQTRDARDVPAQQAQSTPVASAPAATSVQDTAARTPAHPSASTDAVIVRARATLHAAMPMFREWEDSSGASLSLKDAGAAPFTTGPVVGDFDEDGAPDVAFIGVDAQGEHVIAVLSHKGQPVVETVASDATVPASGPQHRRWMRSATVFTDKDQLGLEVVVRNDRGVFPLPPAQYVYYEGHFMRWIEGD